MSSATMVPTEAATAAPASTTLRRCAILLFVFFNFVYLLTSSGRLRTFDEYMTFFETDSIATQQSTAVPQAVKLNYYFGKFDPRGLPRVPFSPAHPLASLPWYAMGRLMLHVPGVPASASDFVLEAAVCFSSATFAAAAVAFLFLIFCKLGLDIRLAAMAASVVALTTPLFAYSSWYFSEPLATALMLGALYVTFARCKGEAVTVKAAVQGGCLLAIAAFVRPAHALAALVFVVALLVRDRKQAIKPAFALAASSAFGIAVLMLYNLHIFGNAFELGYPTVAEAGKRLNSFETPLLTGLFGFLLSPGKSILLFAPLVLVAGFGIRRLWQMDRGIATVSGLALPTYLLFYARYTQWEGGYCVGPRYLVPALTLFCVGIAPMMVDTAQRVRAAIIATAAAGFVVQVVSIATSFMESQVRGAYYVQNWTYRMSYSLWSQAQVLVRHVSDPTPARLGLGFDRWFVFLAKADVSKGVVAAVIAVMVLAAVFAASRLLREIASMPKADAQADGQ